MQSTGSRRALFLFAAASLAAVGAGSAIMALMGLPPSSWFRNLVAWFVGMLLAGALLAGGRSPLVPKVILGMTVLALAATFLAPAQDGVHRWIDAGPLHLNVAALLLPAAVTSLPFVGIGTRAALAALTLIAALLVLQPDASQATSFALAIAILVVRSRGRSRLHIAGVGIAVLAAAIASTRPDPLEPVAEVEEIFAAALLVSPALAALAGIALAAATLSPLAIGPAAGEEARSAAFALAGYMAAAALCPLFGAFPVPLVGLGMSFIVGYWLAIGLLCAKTSTLGR